MIVWNEFLHDARVTKEAETLTKAGYDVTVLALYLPGRAPRLEDHPSGFSVVRVPFFSQGIWRGIIRLVSRLKFWFKAKKTENSKEYASKTAALTGNPRIPRPLLSLMAVPAKFITHCALLREAVRQKADIYHAHDFNVLLTTWLASRLRASRIVYDAHEITTDREGYKMSRWFVRQIEGVLVHKVNGMITTNLTRGDFFCNEYGIKPPVVLQNRSKYQAPLNSNKLREILDLNAQVPIVLYQGGIQSGRGMRNLVHVAERVEDAYFVYLGSGGQEQVIKEMVKAKKLEDRVFLLPMVPLQELPVYTASGDIGVQILRNTCLNHYTTESNKLFEYLMAGLPVIVSDFPEMRQIVEEYEVGIIVNPDDVEGIAAAVKRLISDRSLYQRLRRNALASAKKLSWEEQEERLLALYRGL
jgi:glycosyltransferase involved in cell wall biosynthesis